MLILLYLVQSNYAKIQQQEIPSLSRKVLDLFCVFLCSEFLSDLYKKKN